MDTPIYDFIKKYNKQNTMRLHMPGHKGKTILGFENMDITEILGADDLSSPNGIIKQSEENASKLFGTRKTLYSTGGSSQCISAMIYIAMIYGNNKKILAGRNAHKAFLHTAALLDLDVCWLYPKNSNSICSCDISKRDLEITLKNMEELPFAVFVTSPNYLGEILDIKGLSEICKKFNIPLLVDNAHGAYLKFLQPSLHPMDLRADMCTDSAHKTLPVLTGGAYLHISKTALCNYEDFGKKALSLFGSSSPSYLILQSLDYCNKLLDDNYTKKLENVCKNVDILKNNLKNKGYEINLGEPLKLVIDCKKTGVSGENIAYMLREKNIEMEFCDNDFVVLMFSSENTEDEILCLSNAFSRVTKKNYYSKEFSLPKGEQVLSIREAMLRKSKKINSIDAVGEICATPNVSCPPAIPIAITGEKITKEMIDIFLFYGILEIDVIN